MCQWEPLGGLKSPDRLDALVWALTKLMLGTRTGGMAMAADPDEDYSEDEDGEEDLSLWQ
jgi:hypothetical protein